MSKIIEKRKLSKNIKTYDLVFSTNAQKVLFFLLQHPDIEFYDRQISNITQISRAGANFALRDLVSAGLVMRKKHGRMCFYWVEGKDILIKQLKLVQNLIGLKMLIDKLKKESLKIILYGSAGKGENTEESDIDIFVLTRKPDKIKREIRKFKNRNKLQIITYTPNEYAKMRKDNPVFHKEISKGLTIWEEI